MRRKMLGVGSSLMVGLLFLTMPASVEAATFYVSPAGNDTNPGTLEKPFVTLRRAQQAVRKQRSEARGQKSEQIAVYLRGGTYYLFEPLVFTPEDSGAKDAPVIFQAYENEAPVISGGAKLDLKWTPYKDGIIRADVSGFKFQDAGFSFDQLFINGQRQHLARYPNYSPRAEIFGGTAADAISPERVRRWANPLGGFVHALHKSAWGGFHYRITGVDEKGNLKLEGGWQNNRPAPMHDKERFVENIFEELDAPGEWYLHRTKGVLYFMPPQGLDLAGARVEVAGIRHLFEFRGSREKPVQFVTLKGLTLTHTARTFMETKEPLMRSDWTIYRGGAVLMEGTEDCAVRDCFFDAVGGNAVFVSNYNRRAAISGCKISEAGASGICLVGDPGALRNAFYWKKDMPVSQVDKTPGPKTANYPAQCVVEDNLIYRIGRVEKQSAGVEIQMAEELTVNHNSIYDVPRAGINIGDGAWGGHLIENNDVFDTVKETGDHGPFNSWGRDRHWNPGTDDEKRSASRLDSYKTTIIRHNRFAHGKRGHSWGIDLDDGSSNYQLVNNLALGCSWKLREGFYRVVENNVSVGRFPPGKHCCFSGNQDVIRRNIYVNTAGANAQEMILAKPAEAKEIDYNLYWNARGTSPAFRLSGTMPEGFKGRMTLAEWQAKGLDVHSLFADPLFADPDNDDFRVKPESPALQLGFKNFPMDDFGSRKPALRAEAQSAWKAFRPQLQLLGDGAEAAQGQ